LVHCLDGATGRPQWKHDARAYTWGSPLIVDGKIYVGTEDGEVLVFALSRNKSLLFTARWESHVTISPIYASPIFANGVLYIATQNELLAIRRDAWSRPVKRAGRP
ncbi:MAG: PQQ-like beta-propeller repeat protein, partial [Nitrospira sp.]|nr:PQQ-like beta-propeller repeat protein [Nitrospira sp.]